MGRRERKWKYTTRFKQVILPTIVFFLVAVTLFYFSLRSFHYYSPIRIKLPTYIAKLHRQQQTFNTNEQTSSPSNMNKQSSITSNTTKQISKSSNMTKKNSKSSNMTKKISKSFNLSKQTSASSNKTEEIDVTTSKFIDINYAYFRNLSVVESEPKRGENPIMFLETSCILGDSPGDSVSRGLILKPRSACAVESAARANTKRNVYVIYSCPIVGKIEESSTHVKHMLNYTNVQIWFLDVQKYLKYTPLENWEFHKKMNTSKWPLSHASDVLRYISLWKYGGTYLDMDFVIIRSLDELGSNYVGAQEDLYLASGALDFSTKGIGHVIAQLCVRELELNFRGDIWGRNGPDVITKVLGNICGTKQQRRMTRKACLGFRAYPPGVFYKIPYPQYYKFFDEKRINETILELRGSYGAHVWNKYSVTVNVTVGTKQPYGLLANKFCPTVYNNVGPIF